MNHPKFNILRSAGRKLVALVLIGAVSVASFATLGDGRAKPVSSKTSLLSSKSSMAPGTFTLRSGYTYRGSQVIDNNDKYIRLNTVVTVQRGNITYTVPLRKSVLLDKVKIDIGNRQFQHR